MNHYQMLERQFFKDAIQPLLMDGFDAVIFPSLFGDVGNRRFLEK